MSNYLGQERLLGFKKRWGCMFLQRQTNTRLTAEIGAAALDLLLNLEVTFLRNVAEAGLFSPRIEVLS